MRRLEFQDCKMAQMEIVTYIKPPTPLYTLVPLKRAIKIAELYIEPAYDLQSTIKLLTTQIESLQMDISSLKKLNTDLKKQFES